jgi:hypothetical protein
LPPHFPAPAAPSSPPQTSDSWYTTDDLARLLRVDPSTVRRWRAARPAQGPPFVRLSGRVVLYDPDDVRSWLHARRVDPAHVA